MTTGSVLGNKYVMNGISADVSGFIPHMSADTYYEVVRLIDGKLLFLPDHLERLRQSISGSGTNCPGNHKIIKNLRLLVSENPFREGNIRICLHQSKENEPVLKCYFIPYVYPDKTMYKKGVKLVTYPHIRPNPGIKKWDDQFRSSVGKQIREQGVYEAALINPENQITEGSRSNIFYIDRAGNLITVPEKDILPGITRRYVLEIAKKMGVRLLEKSVTIDELESLVSVFISGTSPKVLPVKQIDDYCFDVDHPLLHQLMDQFDRMVSNNLTKI